jgi:sugar/nucleoside kinase (ribokinase family)
MTRLAYVSKICQDVYFSEDLPEGGKFDPLKREWGGAAATAVPILRSLGIGTDLYGWYTQDDEPFHERANSLRAGWLMEKHDGRGAVNAILPGPRILRVTEGPPDLPPHRAAQSLLERQPSAIVISGSFPDETVAFWLSTAAGLGVPVFWDAGAGADLAQASSGGTVYLKISHAEHQRGQDRHAPEAYARELLLKTGAAGVIVTAAQRGAFGILRDEGKVLHAPALPLDDPLELVGCGDAHLAGFLAAFLQAPIPIRLERGLAIGRLVAARHTRGLAPGNWQALRGFAEGWNDDDASLRIKKAA